MPVIVTWQNGAPVRVPTSPAPSTASKTTRPRAGSTAPAPSCWPSTASPTPTPSRSSTGSRRCCPRSRPSYRPAVDISRARRPLGVDPAAVDDVQFTLMLTVVLVVIVIFLFLRSFRATLIPALALPISLIGTFAGMYVLRLLDR